jgi:hypothetical protein
MMGGNSFSLSLWEGVGVRGSSSALLADVKSRAVSTPGSPPRSQDPLTPTLSRREREQPPSS